VSPEKDVDGQVVCRFPHCHHSHTDLLNRFHAYNIGHLSSRASDPLFKPCTPAAIMHLIDSTGVSLAGANVVVLGRSDIVGNPVASMLRNKDATVTQCHSRTRDIPAIVIPTLSPTKYLSPYHLLPVKHCGRCSRRHWKS
jgi:methylenetetrahydrofolate dehydrogenase (NADP+)/methenyltetrahydrofolate cyclohydrolase/formyltetrahydrofolate synthetase